MYILYLIILYIYIYIIKKNKKSALDYLIAFYRKLQCYVKDKWKYGRQELYWNFHKSVVIMTNMDSTKPFAYKRKNGTNWRKSLKCNVLLSLRIRRKIGLSTPQVSTTSNPKSICLREFVESIPFVTAMCGQGSAKFELSFIPRVSDHVLKEYFILKRNLYPQKLSAVSSSLNCCP